MELQTENGKKKAPLSTGLKWLRLVCMAVVFGIIAGGVMVGMNYLGGRMASEEESIPQTSTVKVTAQAEDSDAVVAVAREAMPSVVTISTMSVEEMRSFFGGTQEIQVQGAGTGVIVNKNESELLIATNNHVVEDSTSLKVAFIDSEVVDAAIKGTDAETDLAVIAVPLEQIKDDTKSKIKVARLGNSDELKVGQGVIAIGNALGYGQSVTVGYVSALNREVRVSSTSTRELLQTDAAINPGNSGGALLNMKGEVIGINAAKYSSTEVEGIGYAIPISKAEDIMNQLMNRKTMNPVEEAKRGYLGIQGTSVDEESAAAFGMPRGVYVYKILEEGAAAQSDLREKDIITKVDGQSVRNMTDLQELLACYEMGEQIDLTVQTQKDGEYQERTVTITLKAMPQENTETQAQ